MVDEHIVDVFVGRRSFSMPMEVFEMMYAAYYYALFYDSRDEDGNHRPGYNSKQADAWKRIAEKLGEAVDVYNRELR